MVQNQINKTKRKNQTKQKKHIKTKRNETKKQQYISTGSGKGKILKWKQNPQVDAKYIFKAKRIFIYKKKGLCILTYDSLVRTSHCAKPRAG